MNGNGRASSSQGWPPVPRLRYAPRLIWNDDEAGPSTSQQASSNAGRSIAPRLNSNAGPSSSRPSSSNGRRAGVLQLGANHRQGAVPSTPQRPIRVPAPRLDWSHSAGPSTSQPSSSHAGPSGAPQMDTSHSQEAPPPPAPIAEPREAPRPDSSDDEGEAPPPPSAPIDEPREAPQLNDDDVEAAIKELGPGSWPRPDATEKQMTEAGEVKRYTAEMKKRALKTKKKLEAMKREKKRRNEEKERAREERLRIAKEEKKRFQAKMLKRDRGIKEQQFLLHLLFMKDFPDLQVVRDPTVAGNEEAGAVENQAEEHLDEAVEGADGLNVDVVEDGAEEQLEHLNVVDVAEEDIREDPEEDVAEELVREDVEHQEIDEDVEDVEEHEDEEDPEDFDYEEEVEEQFGEEEFQGRREEEEEEEEANYGNPQFFHNWQRGPWFVGGVAVKLGAEELVTEFGICPSGPLGEERDQLFPGHQERYDWRYEDESVDFDVEEYLKKLEIEAEKNPNNEEQKDQSFLLEKPIFSEDERATLWRADTDPLPRALAEALEAFFSPDEEEDEAEDEEEEDEEEDDDDEDEEEDDEEPMPSAPCQSPQNPRSTSRPESPDGSEAAPASALTSRGRGRPQKRRVGMDPQIQGSDGSENAPTPAKRSRGARRDRDSDSEDLEDLDDWEHLEDEIPPQLHPELPDVLYRLLNESDFGNALRSWMEDPNLRNFQMEGVELKLHLFDPTGPQELPQKVRKVSNGKDLFMFNAEAKRKKTIKRGELADLWKQMTPEAKKLWSDNSALLLGMQIDQQKEGWIELQAEMEYK